MKIVGTVEIILDEVDIEQALINHGVGPSTRGKPFIVHAAAYDHPQIKSLKLFLDREKHYLAITASSEIDAQHTRVVFAMRAKSKHQIIAEEAGLA